MGWGAVKGSALEVNEAYARHMGYMDEAGGYTCAGKTNCVANVMLVALFVLGCMTVTGYFSAAEIGWTSLGIGSGTLLMQVMGGQLRARAFDVLTTTLLSTALIAIGALGGIGMLSSATVGYSAFGIVLGGGALYLCGFRTCFEINRQKP